MEQYKCITGGSNSAQELMLVIDNFLRVDIGGWTKHATESDTSTYRDYVWTSPGESPTDYDTIYVRLRAQSGYLYGYGYSDYTNSTTYTGMLYDSSKTVIQHADSFHKYVIFGNKDFFQIILQQDDSFGFFYGGLIHSYFLPETDSYPLAIKGSYSMGSSYSPWNHSYGQPFMHDCVDSTARQYAADLVLKSWVDDYDLQLRKDKVLLLPLILYCTATNASEVRGEPFGVYYAGDKSTAKGTFIDSDYGDFYVSGYTDTHYAYGPLNRTF